MRHLFFDPGDLIRERLALRLPLRQAVVPQILEHGARGAEQTLGGLKGAQDRLKLALDHVAPDRLAEAAAGAVMAQVIGMQARAALRPGRRERAPAIIAQHEAAQGETLLKIAPDGRAVHPVQTVLNALEGFVADQALVLAGAARNAPVRRFHIARITALAQNERRALMTHDPALVFREQRMGREEPRHVGLRLEPARGKTLQRLPQDRRRRLVAHKHLAAPRHPPVFVTHRSLEHPVAIGDARLHAVFGLLAVLLALMLGDGGEKIFHKLGIRIVAELDGRGFQMAARRRDGAAKLDMRLHPARQARDIVDDDGGPPRAALAQPGQHGLHPGTVRQASRHVVREHLNDLMALHARELPAARFLRAQTITHPRLLHAGHAAVNHRFHRLIIGHKTLYPFRAFLLP